MPRYMALRLEAPLVAFGDTLVDAWGPVRDVPGSSMLTGLVANALGVRREQGARLQRIQDRLVYGCRLERRGVRFTDFQTAQLGANDRGWTTWGRVEGRTGGASTYDSPYIRRRQHDADVCCTVVVRLEPEDESPTLDDVGRAIVEPFRPLFIGRKPCLPSHTMFAGFVEAESAFSALLQLPMPEHDGLSSRNAASSPLLFALSWKEPRPEGFREHRSTEQRDWVAGVHTGESVSYRADVDVTRLTPARELAP